MNYSEIEACVIEAKVGNKEALNKLINTVSKYKEGSNTFNIYAYTSIKNSFKSSLRKIRAYRRGIFQ